MRIVSGIQPTGNLHLGNFLGAIKQWVNLQSDGECYFFLADLHAITTRSNPKELRNNCQEMAASLIACGVDHTKSVLFNQARVPYHAELSWILQCTARVGWLNRMVQFKEKGANSEGESVGLYSYPVLQAADILLYHATHVPVGDDQQQHLQLTKDIANKFNNEYGKVFTIPVPKLVDNGTRVMSLQDGTRKMSKSDENDMSRINLVDDADTITKKLKRAKSDTELLPDNLEELCARPEALNLLTIYAAITNSDMDSALTLFSGKGYGVLKPAVAEVLVETFRPIKKTFDEIKNDNQITEILQDGADRAAMVAKPTIEQVFSVIGLDR